MGLWYHKSVKWDHMGVSRCQDADIVYAPIVQDWIMHQ